MNKMKTKANISKVMRLVSVLQKCNGKATVGDSNALISSKAAKTLGYVGLLLLTAVLFLICWFLEPVIAVFIPIEHIVMTLMLVLLLMCFVLAIKNIVTVLYTADDLSVLLPMPFSASQIVTAKLMVSSKFPLFLSLILLNSVGLGFGIRAGMGVTFVIGTVLSSVLVPLTSISVATLLVVIVFRVFGFIRNRDITMVLGGVFTILLSVTYIFINNKLQGTKSSAAAAAAFSGIAGVTNGFPNLSFMGRFMFAGDILGLVISLAITAAIIALALLAVRLFYLATALSMQTTGTRKKAVAKGSLGGKKSNALKALTSYEARSARRNPAYMVNGFAMSFIWPLFMILPIVFGNKSFMEELTWPLNTTTVLFCSLFLGLTASGFACGFNVLPVSAFSREGSAFGALRSMPIDFKDYYRSKRNFSLLICSLGSVAYILILGIACAVAGFTAPQNILLFVYAAVVSFLANIVTVNCMLLKNSAKPNFTWDSETEIGRKLCWVNVVSIVIGSVAMIALLVGMIVFQRLEAHVIVPATTIIAIVCTVMLVALAVAAFAVNRLCIKKAEKNLSAFE